MTRIKYQQLRMEVGTMKQATCALSALLKIDEAYNRFTKELEEFKKYWTELCNEDDSLVFRGSEYEANVDQYYADYQQECKDVLYRVWDKIGDDDIVYTIASYAGVSI